MNRWEVVIPAVSIVRAVPVMPPPRLVLADPSHSASLPPLSAVVHRSCHPTPPPSQKKRDAVVLFPPRRIEQGMKPPPTGCGSTCIRAHCLPPDAIRQWRRRRFGREQRRDEYSESAHGNIHATGEVGQRDVLHPQRQCLPNAASNRRGNS